MPRQDATARQGAAGVGADFVAAPKPNPRRAIELTPNRALELWHGVLDQRTVKGAVFLREFADLVGQAAGRL